MSKMITKQNKTIRIIIIVLSVLLVLSIGALAVRALYLKAKSDGSTVIVSGNQIMQSDVDAPVSASEVSVAPSGENDGSLSSAVSTASPSVGQAAAPLLEFYKGHTDANRKFEVRNMVPGDLETRYFCIRAHHQKTVTLVFNAEVTEQTRQLGDVLDVLVSDAQSGAVICEGTFNEINGLEYKIPLAANAQKQTTKLYRVEVSMDTSVGNDYQVARLLADLNWYIEEDSADGLAPLPQTGDSVNILLWVAVAGSAFFILFLLLFARRREEEEESYE